MLMPDKKSPGYLLLQSAITELRVHYAFGHISKVEYINRIIKAIKKYAGK